MHSLLQPASKASLIELCPSLIVYDSSVVRMRQVSPPPLYIPSLVFQCSQPARHTSIMLAPLSLLGVVATAALRANAATSANVTSALTILDLEQDVAYYPSSVWMDTRNSVCADTNFFTTTVGAYATFAFVGEWSSLVYAKRWTDHVRVGDMIGVAFERTNVGGVVSIRIDEDPANDYDLWSNQTACGLFADIGMANGTHTVTITLTDQLNSRGSGITPEMMITSLMYVAFSSRSAPLVTEL